MPDRPDEDQTLAWLAGGASLADQHLGCWYQLPHARKPTSIATATDAPARPYLLGTIASGPEEGKVVVQLQGRKDVVSEDLSLLLGANEGTQQEVHDLTRLQYIHVAAVCEVLEQRYHAARIYTSVGAMMLLCLNPFKNLGLTTPETALRIRKMDRAEVKQLQPHVFQLAAKAWHRFIDLQKDGGGNCSFVISGESGAGKTVACVDLLRFFTTPEGGGSEPDKVTTAIMAGNPILEALGNARTPRNNNSSRFGRFIKLYTHVQPGTSPQPNIVGGEVSHYLLEKSRITHAAPKERNYHVFYQLLRGLPADELQQLGVPHDWQQLKYLARTREFGVPGMDDVECWAETLAAFRAIHLTDQEVLDVKKLLVAVLLLGEVEFEAVSVEGEDQVQVSAQSASAYERVCVLLGIDPARAADSHDCMFHAVTRRVITVGAEKTESWNSVERASGQISTAARELYSHLFDWFVHRINEAVSERAPSWIGVLDIFGFETMEQNGKPTNSLEQLLINYANERLQNFFVVQVFEREKQVYEAEGLDASIVEFTDNHALLEAIDGKSGILDFLNSSCAAPTGTDKTFFSSLQGKKSSHYVMGKGLHTDQFTVHHSMGHVHYLQHGFREKNMEEFSDELCGCFDRSSVALLDALFDLPEAGTKRKKEYCATKFKASIQSLMDVLESSNPFFVRCIKPNMEKQFQKFDFRVTASQLASLSVLDALSLAQKGYSSQVPYKDFATKYQLFQLVHHFPLPEIPAKAKGGKAKAAEGDDGEEAEGEGEGKGEAAASESSSSDSDDDGPQAMARDAMHRALCGHIVDTCCGTAPAAPAEDGAEEGEGAAQKPSSRPYQEGKTLLFLKKQSQRTVEAVHGRLRQACVRIHADVLNHAMMAKESKLQEQNMHRAERIQGFARGFLARASGRKCEANRRRLWAALSLITCVRRFNKQRCACMLMQTHMRNLLMLQRTLQLDRAQRLEMAKHKLLIWHQVAQAREEYKHMLLIAHKQEVAKCVTRVSGLWRRKANLQKWYTWGRLHYSCKRLFQDRVRSIVRLQAKVRGQQLRSTPIGQSVQHAVGQVRQARLHGASVLTIQRITKAFLTSRQFARQVDATKIMQHYLRCMGDLSRYKRAVQAAKGIQRLYRGWRVRAFVLWQKLLVLWRGEQAVLARQNRLALTSRRPCHVAPGQCFPSLVWLHYAADPRPFYPEGWVQSYADLIARLELQDDEVDGLAVGAEHTVCLSARGQVYSWGCDAAGQLGCGDDLQSPVRSPVKSPSRSPRKQQAIIRRPEELRCFRLLAPFFRRRVVQVACGRWHSLAVEDKGECFAWGSNHRGQCGVKTFVKSQGYTPQYPDVVKEPAALQLPGKCFDVSCGACSSAAVCGAKLAYCWGEGSSCGSARDLKQPLRLSQEPVHSVHLGDSFGLVLTDRGQVLSFGCRGPLLGIGCVDTALAPVRMREWSDGELSESLGVVCPRTRFDRDKLHPESCPPVPILLPPHMPVQEVAVGEQHCVALLGGSVWEWGLRPLVLGGRDAEDLGLVCVATPQSLEVDALRVFACGDASLALLPDQQHATWRLLELAAPRKYRPALATFRALRNCDYLRVASSCALHVVLGHDPAWPLKPRPGDQELKRPPPAFASPHQPRAQPRLKSQPGGRLVGQGGFLSPPAPPARTPERRDAPAVAQRLKLGVAFDSPSFQGAQGGAGAASPVRAEPRSVKAAKQASLHELNDRLKGKSLEEIQRLLALVRD